MINTESSPTRLVSSIGNLPTSLRVRRFRVRVIEGTDKGQAHIEQGDRMTVGSASGATLLLNDRTVSRVHLEIAATPEGYILRDLDSTNGTYLDGNRIKEVYLRDGAQIGIGNTLLELSLRDDESDIELSPKSRFGQLVGADPAMRRLFKTMEQIAPTDATILITGETGTGKELVARAIHEHSARRSKPMVVVDAGSLPSTLIESELFGHERGAFTGATTTRIGAFEEADGGTVFLDELGELPIELQPKLLRVLEQREVRKVGSNRPTKVDVRIIAATNRDLRKEINSGNFRADLFYRLAVVMLSLPSLRERASDIPLLAKTFLNELGQMAGKRLDLPDSSLKKLQSLPWWGNVRELRNFIERSMWLSEGPELRFTGMLKAEGALPKKGAAGGEVAQEAPRIAVELPYKIAKKQWTDYFDTVYLPAIIERFDGNVTKAAREADIDRAYLSRLLHRYGLKD